MTYSSCLSDADSRLVLDASVVINIMATGQSVNILEALRRPLHIPAAVAQEIEDGERSDRRQISVLHDLIHGQLVEVADLADEALATFFTLVSCGAGESLGDGEAATIALSVACGGSAVIDEKLATKICTSRYPSLRMVTSIDILAHPSVEAGIGRVSLANATLDALLKARMQVREPQFDWIAELIGPEGVAQCSSLRRLARTREQHQSPIRIMG